MSVEEELERWYDVLNENVGADKIREYASFPTQFSQFTVLNREKKAA